MFIWKNNYYYNLKKYSFYLLIKILQKLSELSRKLKSKSLQYKLQKYNITFIVTELIHD